MGKFKLTFSPHIKESFIIENNSIQDVLKVLTVYWEKDYSEYIRERCQKDFSIIDMFKFYRASDDYSFGWVSDGINEHFFEINEVE